MEPVESAEYVELLEDGSVVEDDGISIISSMVSSASVVKITEAFMDELCVNVENDLLGKDENYKDIIRDYRKYKQSQRHSTSGYDTEEEEITLSSSYGAFSDEDDIESLSMEKNEGNRTKAIIQALFLGGVSNRKKVSRSTVEPKTHKMEDISIAEVEPTYNAGAVANLDSVEVGSIKDRSEEKSDSQPVDLEKANLFSPESDASTEEATDVSSSHSDGTDTMNYLDNDVASQMKQVRHPEPHQQQRDVFISILDTASHHSEFTRAEPSPAAAVLSNHLKQRRAIYLWSLSVLQHKLEEQQKDNKTNNEEIRLFMNATRKPQSILEYDHTIVRALTLSMSHDSVETVEDSAYDITESRPFLVKCTAAMWTTQGQARKMLEKSARIATIPLKLQRKVKKSDDGSDLEGALARSCERDWKRLQNDIKQKAAVTTQKSLQFLQEEAKADAFYVARQLKKRALKLHAALSVLGLALAKKDATSETVVNLDPFDDLSVGYREESVEVKEPSTTKKKIGSFSLKRMKKWKVVNKIKHPRKWNVPESLNLSFSSRQWSSSTIDLEEKVVCPSEFPESRLNDEETGGFEVTL